jgi:hypothetical protein
MAAPAPGIWGDLLTSTRQVPVLCTVVVPTVLSPRVKVMVFPGTVPLPETLQEPFLEVSTARDTVTLSGDPGGQCR